MRCATTTATVLLCFLINSFVRVQPKVDDFEAWIIDDTENAGTLKKSCGALQSGGTLDAACKTGAQCTGEQDAALTACNNMCGKFSQTYSCDGTLEDQMPQLKTCVAKKCPDLTGEDNHDYQKCIVPCIKTYATSGSVANFLSWVDSPTGKFQTECVTKPSPGDKVSTDCEQAATTGVPKSDKYPQGTPDNWDAMCAALAKFDCTDAGKDVTEFEKCCKNEDAPAGCLSKTYTEKNDWTGEGQCCAVCITASQTTTKPPPSSHSAPTTMGPTPTPGTAPSTSKPEDKDTTTEETTTTDGGSDSDSAINIGASGLLVTLITMLAAVVNIA